MDHHASSTESGGGNSALIIPACNAVPNCNLSADIVLVSSDGDRFGTHSQNLGSFTGGFPLHIAPTNHEEVRLPDLDSATLALFLQFVHHHRQPDLTNISFETLNALAEAVEKYDVYSATEVCRLHMKSHVSSSSYLCTKVFLYASKHNYNDLMNEAARVAVEDNYLRNSMETILYNTAYSQAWASYSGSYIGLFDNCRIEPALVLHPGGVEKCTLWSKFANIVCSNFPDDLSAVSGFHELLDYAKYQLDDCRHCHMRADRWKKKVARHAREFGSPRFTDFL